MKSEIQQSPSPSASKIIRDREPTAARAPRQTMFSRGSRPGISRWRRNRPAVGVRGPFEADLTRIDTCALTLRLGPPMSSDQLLDKRILDRNLAKGLVTQKEVDKHLAGLADKSANAEYLDPAASLAEELEAIEGALSQQAARQSAAAAANAAARRASADTSDDDDLDDDDDDLDDEGDEEDDEDEVDDEASDEA